ncbi:MAG TPA: CidA/LrgA family protein [Longimicrobium sp.]|nr:CidA/LrgA family protein [Longimicrobium sp.]
MPDLTRGRQAAHYALGLLILLAFLWIGDTLAAAGRLPLPGSVVGMLMLASALRLRWIPERVVRPAAELLIRNMALLFVPAGVGVMTYAGLLRREWLPITAGAAASTVAVLLVVGWTQQRLERRG